MRTEDLSCDREGDELSLSQWGPGFLQETYQAAGLPRRREDVRQLKGSCNVGIVGFGLILCTRRFCRFWAFGLMLIR